MYLASIDAPNIEVKTSWEYYTGSSWALSSILSYYLLTSFLPFPLRSRNIVETPEVADMIIL